MKDITKSGDEDVWTDAAVRDGQEFCPDFAAATSPGPGDARRRVLHGMLWCCLLGGRSGAVDVVRPRTNSVSNAGGKKRRYRRKY